MELITTYRPVLATVAGIMALLILVLRARMNAFSALILIAILSALAAGMSPDGAFDTVTKGMGGVLGFIAPVIGLGALFGIILEASGGHSGARVRGRETRHTQKTKMGDGVFGNYRSHTRFL